MCVVFAYLFVGWDQFHGFHTTGTPLVEWDTFRELIEIPKQKNRKNGVYDCFGNIYSSLAMRLYFYFFYFFGKTRIEFHSM